MSYLVIDKGLEATSHSMKLSYSNVAVGKSSNVLTSSIKPMNGQT